MESYPDEVSEHFVGTESLLPQSDAVEMTVKLSGGHRHTTFSTHHFSMCGRCLWSVEGSFQWLENYPDGVSRHSVPLQWAQEVCSHGYMQWK